MDIRAFITHRAWWIVAAISWTVIAIRATSIFSEIVAMVIAATSMMFVVLIYVYKVEKRK